MQNLTDILFLVSLSVNQVTAECYKTFTSIIDEPTQVKAPFRCSTLE